MSCVFCPTRRTFSDSEAGKSVLYIGPVPIRSHSEHTEVVSITDLRNSASGMRSPFSSRDNVTLCIPLFFAKTSRVIGPRNFFRRSPIVDIKSSLIAPIKNIFAGFLLTKRSIWNIKVLTTNAENERKRTNVNDKKTPTRISVEAQEKGNHK